MKKVLLFLALSIAFLTGCDDDPPKQTVTNVNLNFKAVYDGETLIAYEEYTYPDGRLFRIDNFNFFVSDIALVSEDVNGNSQETELEDIAFINLTFPEEQVAEAEAGYTLNFVDIPTGEYNGLKIGFGVAADLNRSKPAEYGAGHPLTQNYWEGWSSYIFSQLEGAADMNNNGEIVTGGADTEVYTYHAGTDDVYNSHVFSKIIELDGDSNTISIEIDVKELFRNTSPDFDQNGDGYLDIQTFSASHSDPATMPITGGIMQNFSLATSVND